MCSQAFQSASAALDSEGRHAASSRCHDQTELAKFSVRAVERLKSELIAVGQPRAVEGINRRDPVTSRHEGGEFIVSIPDRNSGWQWYRFRIYAR